MHRNCSIHLCRGNTFPHWPAPVATSALAKSMLVITLGWLFAWHPGLAMRMGRLVLRLWPGFERT